MVTDRLLSRKEAAYFLNVSPKTIAKYDKQVKEGQRDDWHFVEFDGMYKYRPEDLEAFSLKNRSKVNQQRSEAD